ncbi:hypothetical protein Vadar_030561 [Vaccinium darrowii]|uniref:Uncharacterized protein n=1 Tax=Vaccinium darrowii TaxID=229202 RepID=A0ACB7XUA0_9ERIC|nr:hypothetical protein Vadar_030561 [Vaccinium darrowii]
MEELSDFNIDPKKNLTWTQEMDDYLIEVLHEQFLYGRKIDRSFTATAYANASKAMSQKFGENISKAHIKNRLKTIKQNFNLAYDLVKKSSGLGWNQETRMLEADPEVWKELIASNPDAKKFYMRPIPKFDQLEAIFGRDRATGAYAETAKEKRRRWAKERRVFDSVDGIDQLVAENEVHLENFDDMIAVSSPLPTSQKNHMEPPSSSRGNKRKGAMVELLLEQLQVCNNGIVEVAAALREGNQVLHEGNLALKEGQQRVYSEEEVFKELENIGVEEDLLFRAYNFITSNTGLVRAFFGCPTHRRKAWLTEKMRGPSNSC